jgi:membrane associated rhomboid family serine protease
MQSQFSAIPDITKNLIILNLLMFLATLSLENIVPLYCVQYYIENPSFQPYQLVTSFFMHIDFWHIFFNMLVLFLFGADVERTLGPKKFLFIYLSAGFGANMISVLADYFQVHQLMIGLSSEQIEWSKGLIKLGANDVTGQMRELGNLWFTRSLGASGATYGILFTFAALYPNRTLHLLFPPIPIKATYLVLAMATFEFISEMSRVQTGIGHIVHLLGAVIALGIIWVWRKQGARF